MKKILSLVLALAMLCAMSVPALAEDTVKIGVVLPMSGGSARNGEMQLEGMKLFADYCNETLGGIKALGGAKLELVLADSTGTPEVGASECERLINSGEVAMMTGTYNSNVATSLVPICEKYGMPFVITNATAVAMLENPNLKYSFRSNNSGWHDAAIMEQCIDLLNNEHGEEIDSVYIVYETTDWGAGDNTNLTALFEARGWKVHSDAFDAGVPDFSTIINKVKASDADLCVAVMQVADAILWAKQYDEYKVKIPYAAMGGGFNTDEFVVNTGDLSENLITIAGWSIDALYTSADPELALAMNEKCLADIDSNVTEAVANGWLGMGMIYNALETAGTTDPEVLAETLKNIKIGRDNIALLMHNYEGVEYGDVQTMHHQNKYAQMSLLQIQDGLFRCVFPAGGAELIWEK